MATWSGKSDHSRIDFLNRRTLSTQTNNETGQCFVFLLYKIDTNLNRRNVTTMTSHYCLHVVERGGRPEVLLLETELLASHGVVVGVQDTGDFFGISRVLDRLFVVALVEAGEIKATGGLAAPETDVVAVLGAVSGDGDVVGNRLDTLARDPAVARDSILVLSGLDMASESDLDRDIETRQLPWVIKVQPVVRVLCLITIDNSMG